MLASVMILVLVLVLILVVVLYSYYVGGGPMPVLAVLMKELILMVVGGLHMLVESKMLILVLELVLVLILVLVLELFGGGEVPMLAILMMVFVLEWW